MADFTNITHTMTNVFLLREFIQEVWNEKRLDRISRYVAEDYTVFLDNADPWEGKTLMHEEFKTRLHYSFNSFSDIHFEITSSIEDGNTVAINWVMTGMNDGKIGDIQPTHKRIQAEGITLYHFRNGKICGHSQVFDRAAIMRQLGFTR